MKKQILVTGGVGYIGSHTCIELHQAGYEFVVIDNLSNSNPEALKRVEKIIGKQIDFYKCDIQNENALENIFKKYSFFAVLHFAGLKAVGESVSQPLTYYKNNVLGTLKLLEVMQSYNVNNIVFSSSATVYGKPESLPITELADRSCTNPYGQTKLTIEYMLEDLVRADPKWVVLSLRYFNPVGAHESGLIGEDPNGVPTNLMPYISQVAVGKLEKLKVFGNDYDTVDGTGVRDFIHVVDLAKGHVAALKYIEESKSTDIGFCPVNLGTGKGTSVLQLLRQFEISSLKNIPFEVVSRRDGDVASCYAGVEKANSILGWTATHTLENMCLDTWKWQYNNPDGY